MRRTWEAVFLFPSHRLLSVTVLQDAVKTR